MPKISGRSVGYGRKGIAKAKRAKKAGKKVTGLTRRSAAGGGKKKAGAKVRASKAGGATVHGSGWKAGTKKAKMKAGKAKHYAGLYGAQKKRTRGVASGGSKAGAGKGKRGTLRAARAGGKINRKTAQRARKFAQR